jgi:hypothetical protein
VTAPITVTHALTLHRPWTWAITHAGKRIENRGWPPYAWLIGKHLAIHAGKHFDEDAAIGLRPLFPGLEISDASIPHSQIVAVAQVRGWIDKAGHAHVRTAPGHDDPKHDYIAEARALMRSIWFSGPIGWVLGEPLVFDEPVRTRGFQGVWALPPAVLAKVNEQLARGAVKSATVAPMQLAEPADAPPTTQVIDLFEALKSSLAGGKP